MTKHALLSPSSAHRWMVCAGSVALHASDGEEACAIRDEGTAMHAVAHMVLTGAQPDAMAYLGTNIIDDDINVQITEDHCDLVQEYVDAIRRYETDAVSAVYETEVDIGRFTGEPGAVGTVDATMALKIPGRGGEWELQVHDLKTGFAPVSPKRNKQLMLYALPLAAIYAPGHPAAGVPPARIRFVIHQPRVYSTPQEWSCDMAELYAFAEEVGRAAEAAREADECALLGTPIPPELFAPSADACQYCSAKAGCKALEASVYATIGSPPADPQATLPVAMRAVLDASAERIAKQYLALPLIEMFCKAVAARAYAMASLPGLKRVMGRKGKRKWSDPEAAAAVLKKMRYRDDEMYKQVVISPTAAEKMLKDAAPKRWAKLAPLITRDDGHPVLVEESDPREAIRPVADTFKNLDNDIGDLL